MPPADAPTQGFIHEVILKELQIGRATYYYRANVGTIIGEGDEGDEPKWSEVFTFRTRSNNLDASVKFAAIAEQGVSNSTGRW